MKVLVINGYNLNADDWETVMWGERNRPGRFPMGLYIALQEEVDYIVWNTGGSYKDNVPEGKYIFQYAEKNLHRLSNWFPAYFKKTDIRKLLGFLTEKSIVEVQSHNTAESVRELHHILSEKGITASHIIQISSGNHIARCLIDTQKVFQKEFSNSLLTIRGVPALTCYGTGTIDDVRISETPETQPVDRSSLLDGAISYLNSEKEVIWARYNSMLVANSIVVLLLLSDVSSTNSNLKLGISIGGIVLSACWLQLTRKGWQYFWFCFERAKDLWGPSSGPFNLLETIKPRSGWEPIEWIAKFTIWLFILFYICNTILMINENWTQHTAFLHSGCHATHSLRQR